MNISGLLLIGQYSNSDSPWYRPGLIVIELYWSTRRAFATSTKWKHAGHVSFEIYNCLLPYDSHVRLLNVGLKSERSLGSR
jgi:hypothetical protein